MRTLYEGILSDIEDTLKDGDEYVDAVKALDITKKLSTKDWEPLSNDSVNSVYSYAIKCPKWLTMIGLNNFTQIYIEISIGSRNDIDCEAVNNIYLTNDDFTNESSSIQGIISDSFNTFGNGAKQRIYQVINRAIKNSINSKNSEKLRKLILSQI